MPAPDATRIPVVVGVGQAIEREEVVAAVDLAERAARAALADAPGLAATLQRVTVVAVSFSPVGRAPASDLARRLGLANVQREVSTAGGNSPQWLVTRAAHEISEGRLASTLIAGAEATRSMRARDPDSDFLRVARDGLDDEPGDEQVGPSATGMLGPGEAAARLLAPAEVYPLFESALAHAAGRGFAEQRAHIAPLMARFSRVAAANPYAWFRQERSAAEIADVSAENRLTSEPYTKRMNSFPNVDQGCALLVTSLAVARAAGLEDRCIYPWAGATNAEVAPSARPDPGDAPALRAASRAALAAAGVGIDDVAHLDCYSCFPVAVQAAALAHGVSLDDPRGLTVTGGMPFFGGPGNNYSSHGIASLVEKLRETGGIGLVNANGGYLSKHSVGVYADRPPKEGFRSADTSAAQRAIEAAACPVVTDAAGKARVVAMTVVYDRRGGVARAPLIASLDDGRRVLADADPAALAGLAGVSLVGQVVSVNGSPPVYRP